MERLWDLGALRYHVLARGQTSMGVGFRISSEMRTGGMEAATARLNIFRNIANNNINFKPVKKQCTTLMLLLTDCESSKRLFAACISRSRAEAGRICSPYRLTKYRSDPIMCAALIGQSIGIGNYKSHCVVELHKPVHATVQLWHYSQETASVRPKSARAWQARLAP